MITIDPKIHIGETHGIFYIYDVLPDKDRYGHWIYDCVCVRCGYHKYSHYGAIAGEKSQTNICNHKRVAGNYLTYGYKWDNKRIGHIFRGMTRRCYDSQARSYRWYGAKGVRICDEWISNPKEFELWALSNGYTDEMTIDRIDSNGDYTPTNCRWIDSISNSKYKTSTKLIEVDGMIHTGREWAAECEFGCNTINTMLRRYSENKVKELIWRRLSDKTKTRKSKQTWFNVYNIN